MGKERKIGKKIAATLSVKADSYFFLGDSMVNVP